jgi:thiamine pyrophosphate-dependent acetolactate synthase large subunit-like protein
LTAIVRTVPVTAPPAIGGQEPAWGSDRIAILLRELGYRYVALNPGASFRGLHDSLANLADAPRIVLATHEEISVAIAHGYAKAAGNPMAAAVHDVVGLQHATMAIYNAWCDQVPVLVIGGTGPVDAAHRRPYIDWVHTALVQGQLVRDYVKWDDQPASLAAALEAIVRADRIVRAEPPGPAYVCLDVEIQEAPLTGEPAPVRPAPPAPIFPDTGAIARAADWLCEAEHPVIIADMLGRSLAAVDDLVRLADRLGLPVVDLGGRFNFPTTHPLDATEAGEDLPAPDLVLALDVVDLAGQLRRLPAAGPGQRRVVHVTTRDLGTRSWTTHYQAVPAVDLAITAAAGPGLAALVEACEARPTPLAVARRSETLASASRARRASWQHEAEASADTAPIALAWLFLRLREALAGKRWSLVNAPIESPWPRRLLSIERPVQYLGGSGGAGIGYAAGASVGAALALRDLDPGMLAVGVLGDGELLYTPGAIWTAVHEQIPLLLVIANNRSYFNSESHAITMARARSRPVERSAIGTRIADPAIDIATLARSMGALGYGPVDDPSTLDTVFADAVDNLAHGAVAVVDVICQPR